MEFDFLSPVSNEVAAYASRLSSQHLGNKIVLHTEKEFPDLEKVRIAIVGVLENRGVSSFEAVNTGHIRKELYGLFPGNWFAVIADLGDLYEGNSAEDTYFALEKVTAALVKRRIIPIIVGGSQDLTYPLYRAFDGLDQMVNLVSVDSRFDLGKHDEQVNATSFLSKIILDQPNNLFNYCNLGYQTYYNSQEEIDLVEKLFFDAYRLGDVSADIAVAEPVFRDADLVSVDLTSVKSCDSGNFTIFTPNGFNGKEICALSRYAGISDKVSVFGIFNHNNSPQESV